MYVDVEMKEWSESAIHLDRKITNAQLNLFAAITNVHKERLQNAIMHYP